MNVRPLAAALFACMLGLGCSGSPARAVERPEQTGRICLSVAQANAIVAAVQAKTIDEMAAANGAFKISSQSTTVLIGTGSSTTVSAPRIAYRGRLTCIAVDDSGQLENLSAIKAAYLLAYRETLAYRSLHAWPGEPANLSAPEADVIFAAYGSYYLVMFSDQVVRRASAGRIVLGCAGEEYYRVNLADEEVRPFNGCIEAGGVRSLPRLSQLPP